MEHTFSLNTSSNPDYKKIPDIYKVFIIDIISQLYEQHSLKLLNEAAQATAQNDQNSKLQRVKEPYHTSKEIQALITKNIEEIFHYFGGRQFPMGAFTDHLKFYTVMRDGDHKRMVSKSCRWNVQVANALSRLRLKNFVIRPGAQRGYLVIEALPQTP